MSDESKLSIPVRRSWVWWLALAVWGAVLFLLSASSHPPMGPEIPFKDKVLHALFFAGGSSFFLMALFGGELDSRRMKAVLAALLFAAIVGALDEWHQTFTPGRSGNDLGDWLADMAGGLMGVSGLLLVKLPTKRGAGR